MTTTTLTIAHDNHTFTITQSNFFKLISHRLALPYVLEMYCTCYHPSPLNHDDLTDYIIRTHEG